MKPIFLVLAISVSLVSSLVAQTAPEIRPGTIMVQIAPEAVPAIASAFGAVRPAADPSFRHTDIGSALLTDDAAIGEALGLPPLFTGLTLRPYVPTHSVAFEDIRERSNPELFVARKIAAPSSSVSGLRTAEDKIARWFVLTYSNVLTPEQAIRLAKKSARIALAEPALRRYPCYTPNDTLVPQQYSLSNMRAFEAWDVVRCDSTMLVADVDVGTDWTHPDLQRAIHLNYGEIGVDSNGLDKRANGVDDDGNGFIDDWHGWDFDGPDGISPDNDPNTIQDHGTHTAGILAATGDNIGGIAGIAFGAKLIPLKVSDNNGASLDFGFQGITYAADMHAKVVSCSWGGPTRSQAEQDIVDYAYSKDCAVVAAAGNNGAFMPYQDFYPAAYNHVLSVSAIDAGDNIAGFSNYNTHVDVAAPGAGVLSTLPGDYYGERTGTSMACPNAAGAVALVRQRFPKLSAGQAIEQVRATARPFVNLDSARIDYEGHGKIDLFQAVTDTNAHSARVVSYLIADDAGKGRFTAGDNGGIIVTALNYLSPVTNLHAHVEVVKGSEFVTLHNSDIRFGAAGTMQEVENIRANFLVNIADSVPANTQILMKLTFLDEAVGYDSDYDYLSFIINPSYLDLNKNNILTSITSKGSIGFEDVVIDAIGSGFVWQNPPPAITARVKSLLFQGGLMIGTDSTHVVDVVEDESSDAGRNDLTPTATAHYVTPDHAAIQQINCAYSDAQADSSIRLGVTVNQQSYEFNRGLSSNAVVLRYVFRKDPSDATPQITDDVAAGLFIDWDIGLSGAINVTKFDTLTNIAITNRLEPGYPYVGMKVLNTLPAGVEVQYHGIRNDGYDGDINTYNGFDKGEKWHALSDFRIGAGPSDVSHTFGIKHMPLLSSDSVVLVIGIALAESPAAVQQTLTETESAWNAPAAVKPDNLGVFSIESYPNPFTDAITLHWNIPLAESAHLEITDLLGRTIATQDVSGASATVNGSELGAGTFFVTVTQGSQHVRTKIVSTR